MKKIIKVLAIIVCVTLIFSLYACGDDDTSSADAPFEFKNVAVSSNGISGEKEVALFKDGKNGTLPNTSKGLHRLKALSITSLLPR